MGSTYQTRLAKYEHFIVVHIVCQLCLRLNDCFLVLSFSNLFPSVDSGAAAMPPPVDIVKVAIEWPGANAQLIEMDQVCVSSS